MINLEGLNEKVNFAILPPREHDLGVDVDMYISKFRKKRASEGPRVEIFKSDPTISFAIILDEDPSKIKLVPGDKPFVTKSELKKLIKGIIMFRKAFLKFYNDPEMSLLGLYYGMDDEREIFTSLDGEVMIGNDFWEMTDLGPETTGLPVWIWIRALIYRRAVKVTPHIKVMTKPVKNFRDGTLRLSVTVTLEDPPRLIGKLKKEYFNAVKKCITLNRKLFIDHWKYKNDSFDLIKKCKKID